MYESPYPPWDFTDRNRYASPARLADIEGIRLTRVSADLALRAWLALVEIDTELTGRLATLPTA